MPEMKLNMNVGQASMSGSSQVHTVNQNASLIFTRVDFAHVLL